MKLEQLKTKLSYIKKSGKYRPFLQCLKITDDGLYCTDLETQVHIKNNYGLSLGYQPIDKLGLVPSHDEDSYPQLILNTEHPRDNVTVKLDDIFYCNEFSSNDETRLCLNTVAFDDSHMVAVNGHILRAFKTKTLSETYLIPNHSIKVLKGLIKGFKLKGDITWQFDDSYAFTENEYFRLSARLIKRDFPRWQAILPKKFIHDLMLTGIPSFKAIKPILDKRTNAVHLSCVDKALTLKIPNSEVTYPLGTYQGDDFILGFNMSYIEAACNGETDINFKFNSSLAPCSVNGAIVMPLKV